MLSAGRVSLLAQEAHTVLFRPMYVPHSASEHAQCSGTQFVFTLTSKEQADVRLDVCDFVRPGAQGMLGAVKAKVLARCRGECWLWR